MKTGTSPVILIEYNITLLTQNLLKLVSASNTCTGTNISHIDNIVKMWHCYRLESIMLKNFLPKVPKILPILNLFPHHHHLHISPLLFF